MATTSAPVADVLMTESVHDRLTTRRLAPGEHVVDGGYTSTELLIAARSRGISLLGPLTADPSPQARAGGYTAEAFAIDWRHQHLTCPQGKRSNSWRPVGPDRTRPRPVISVTFSRATCAGCPVRDRCTTATTRGRHVTLNPRPIQEALSTARAEQTTEAWRARYRIRAGVEGTIAQATGVTGIRHTRYTGLAKVRLEHAVAATAVNLIRLDAWWTGKPLDRTRTTHLQRLGHALAA